MTIASTVDSLTPSAASVARIARRFELTLDEMFIERMVLSWNPYKTKGDEYTKTYSDESFVTKINEIFKMKSSQELWRTSW